MPLYGVKSDDRTVECYVEAKEGAQFSVEVHSASEATLFLSELQLGDGWRDSWIHEAGNGAVNHDHRLISERQAVPLLFAKAETTDTERDAIRDPEKVSDLGSITVTIRRLLGTYNKKEYEFRQQHLKPEQPVYERVKKTGAAFDVEPSIQVKSVTDYTFLPIRFIFRAEVRLALQLKGYIPMDLARPAAKRTRAEFDEQDDEDAAEERRLERELAQLRKRRRARAGDASAVKEERRDFNFAAGGQSAQAPIIINDDDDTDDDADGNADDLAHPDSDEAVEVVE
ncbi:hypothetical protein OC844_005251 [Tilletia horrida]|nr:hypothetical protein OC844_005251 [Tilletia horrida]